MRIVLLLIITLNVVVSGYGQKIKKMPLPFGAPMSFDNQVERDAYANRGGSPGKEYWLIMGDRPKVPLLSRPNGTQTGEYINFRQTGYVMDESDEWVQIGIGSRDDGKFRNLVSSGWVKKTDILLWPKSLRDNKTGITKKGFLLNKLDNVKDILNEHKRVKIYDGPKSENVIGSKDIYNVYFIYKEEEGRVLIGGTDFIQSATAEETILGWVDNIRVEKWNQRLTLEPNWEATSFNDRKKDETKRIYGFKTQSAADLYAKTGSLNKQNVFWDYDPANPTFSDELRSEDNDNRPKGDVFRFPAFAVSSGYIQSGSIINIHTKKPGKDTPSDQIPLEVLIEMKDKLEKYVAPKRNNINVAFLIEGSAKMEVYKPALLAAIENIDMGLPDGANVRYSAGIYRDANISKDGWDFSFTSMTPDRKKVINFVNNTVFNDYTDPDPFTNQRYAINQMLDKAGFVANQNNILIVVGACSDFYYDFGRQESAATEKNKQLIVEEALDNIYEKLTTYDMSMAFLQLEHKAGKAYSKFPEDARSIIVNAAQKQYASYKNITKNLKDIKVPFPEMPDLEEGNTVRLADGIAYGIIKRPNRNATFSHKEITDFIKESVKQPHKIIDDSYQILWNLVNSSKLDSIKDDWPPLVLDYFNKLSSDAQKKIRDEKIALYTGLYLPVSIQGVNEPYKNVIFMPEEELDHYTSQLKDLGRILEYPPNEIREVFYNTIVALLQKLTGDRLSMKDLDKKGLDEVVKISMGIQLEGIQLPLEISDVCPNVEDNKIRIIDIKDKKKVCDEMIQIWGQTLVKKEKQLSEIKRQRSKYPYSYTVNTGGDKDAVYYWLDMNLLDWTETSKK